MKFDNINPNLTGIFICTCHNNYFPKLFASHFSKVVNILTHDHYPRALEGAGLSAKHGRTNYIGSLH